MAKVTKFKCDNCGRENGGADWWGLLLVSDFTKAIIGQLSKFDVTNDHVEHFCSMSCINIRMLELLEKWSGRYAAANKTVVETPAVVETQHGNQLVQGGRTVSTPDPYLSSAVASGIVTHVAVAICQECGQPSDGCPCFVGAVQSLGEPGDWPPATAVPVIPWCRCSPSSLDSTCLICGGKGLPF